MYVLYYVCVCGGVEGGEGSIKTIKTIKLKFAFEVAQHTRRQLGITIRPRIKSQNKMSGSFYS